MEKNQNSPPLSLQTSHSFPFQQNSSISESNSKSNPLEDYISKEDFMSHFGIKRGLYYKLLNKGCLKVYNVGAKSFLSIAEIDKAIKNHQLK